MDETKTRKISKRPWRLKTKNDFKEWIALTVLQSLWKSYFVVLQYKMKFTVPRETRPQDNTSWRTTFEEAFKKATCLTDVYHAIPCTFLEEVNTGSDT